MESGADNNVAVLDYPIGSVLATDLNTFLFREYLAARNIALKLGKRKDANYFMYKAHATKAAINQYLWNQRDQIFYNLNRRDGTFIQRVGYSSLIPLWGNIAPRTNGRAMIKRYLLNTKKLKAPWGIRTLSKDDPKYNQKNIIKPYSNWQGPIWPLVNYLSMQALLNYGFKKEARWLGEVTTKLCLQDLDKTGGMHENYNAEWGEPLAAPNFVSWNLLVGQMINQARINYNPFLIT